MPKVIISDRDRRFANKFWQELFRCLGTTPLMSSSYHPQTDGQMERTIRTLEEMMRCFCDEETSNWDDLLPPLQFAYNNAYQASTQHTPFFMNYGRHPKLPERIALGLPEKPHTDAQQLVSTLAESHSLAKQCISLAQERQSKQANRRRRKEKFEIGQQVWLSPNI